MLKTIVKKCNLHKHVTWHVARHTMATVICLSNDMPIEVVAKLLGHKNIRSTQIYAKITKQKLSQEMHTLRQRLITKESTDTRFAINADDVLNLRQEALQPSTDGGNTIQRSARMTTTRMASLLHAPLRSVESIIMELTGTASASVQYALDTVLAVALLIDTPEADEFVKAIKKRINNKA